VLAEVLHPSSNQSSSAVSILLWTRFYICWWMKNVVLNYFSKHWISICVSTDEELWWTKGTAGNIRRDDHWLIRMERWHEVFCTVLHDFWSFLEEKKALSLSLTFSTCHTSVTKDVIQEPFLLFLHSFLYLQHEQVWKSYADSFHITGHTIHLVFKLQRSQFHEFVRNIETSLKTVETH